MRIWPWCCPALSRACRRRAEPRAERQVSVLNILYDDVRAVLRSPGVFSSHRGATQIRDPQPADLAYVQRMMLNQDPPEHSRFVGGTRAIVMICGSRSLDGFLVRAFDKLAIDEGGVGSDEREFAADGRRDLERREASRYLHWPPH